MNEVGKIKIILVEDDPSWQKIMADFLRECPDFEIVGIAGRKEEALKFALNIPADIVLMDINLTENKRDGITAALEILERTHLKIIMLTSLEEEELITDSFAAGAVEYVTKDNYLDIPTIIRRAIRESSPMDVLLKDYARLKREEQLKELTSAEREVFDLLEEGHTLNQIETKTFKTHNTLRTQVKQILHKLKARTRIEAIKKVESKGVYEKYDEGDNEKE